MEQCRNEEDCSGHGNCEGEKCSCDIGWFSSDCSHSGFSHWGAFWPLFRITFALAFFATAAYAVKHLVKGITVRKSLGCRLRILRLFRSPKNLSMMLIATATALRGLWLAIDPLSFSGLLSRLSDRMLYNTVFFLMYCVYCSLLLVWCVSLRSGLYQIITKQRRLWLRVYRNCIAAVMGISFGLGLGVSACQGKRVSSTTFTVVWFSTVCFLVVFILSGLLGFGVMLGRTVRRKGDLGESAVERESTPVRNTESDEMAPLAPKLSARMRTSVRSLTEPRRLQSIAGFLSALWLQPSAVSSLPTSGDEQSSDSQAWSFSSLTHLGSLPRCSWSVHNSVSFSPPECKQVSTVEHSPEKQRGDYSVEMTLQDRIILRQIVLLTLVSICVGLSVLGLIWMLSRTSLLQNEGGTLAILFVLSAMEVFAYLAVLLIFTTHIQVEAKENLHMISEIALKIAKNPGKVTLPPVFKSISKRLKSYICQ